MFLLQDCNIKKKINQMIFPFIIYVLINKILYGNWKSSRNKKNIIKLSWSRVINNFNLENQCTAKTFKMESRGPLKFIPFRRFSPLRGFLFFNINIGNGFYYSFFKIACYFSFCYLLFKHLPSKFFSIYNLIFPILN